MDSDFNESNGIQNNPVLDSIDLAEKGVNQTTYDDVTEMNLKDVKVNHSPSEKSPQKSDEEIDDNRIPQKDMEATNMSMMTPDNLHYSHNIANLKENHLMKVQGFLKILSIGEDNIVFENLFSSSHAPPSNSSKRIDVNHKMSKNSAFNSYRKNISTINPNKTSIHKIQNQKKETPIRIEPLKHEVKIKIDSNIRNNLLNTEKKESKYDVRRKNPELTPDLTSNNLVTGPKDKPDENDQRTDVINPPKSIKIQSTKRSYAPLQSYSINKHKTPLNTEKRIETKVSPFLRTTHGRLGKVSEQTSKEREDSKLPLERNFSVERDFEVTSESMKEIGNNFKMPVESYTRNKRGLRLFPFTTVKREDVKISEKSNKMGKSEDEFVSNMEKFGDYKIPKTPNTKYKNNTETVSEAKQAKKSLVIPIRSDLRRGTYPKVSNKVEKIQTDLKIVPVSNLNLQNVIKKLPEIKITQNYPKASAFSNSDSETKQKKKEDSNVTTKSDVENGMNLKKLSKSIIQVARCSTMSSRFESKDQGIRRISRSTNRASEEILNEPTSLFLGLMRNSDLKPDAKKNFIQKFTRNLLEKIEQSTSQKNMNSISSTSDQSQKTKKASLSNNKSRLKSKPALRTTDKSKKYDKLPIAVNFHKSKKVELKTKSIDRFGSATNRSLVSKFLDTKSHSKKKNQKSKNREFKIQKKFKIGDKLKRRTKSSKIEKTSHTEVEKNSEKINYADKGTRSKSKNKKIRDTVTKNNIHGAKLLIPVCKKSKSKRFKKKYTVMRRNNDEVHNSVNVSIHKEAVDCKFKVDKTDVPQLLEQNLETGCEIENDNLPIDASHLENHNFEMESRCLMQRISMNPDLNNVSNTNTLRSIKYQKLESLLSRLNTLNSELFNSIPVSAVLHNNFPLIPPKSNVRSVVLLSKQREYDKVQNSEKLNPIKTNISERTSSAINKEFLFHDADIEKLQSDRITEFQSSEIKVDQMIAVSRWFCPFSACCGTKAEN